MNKFYTGFEEDRDALSVSSGLACPVDEDGMPVTTAQQQFKEESDINTIVKRFGLTGELPVVPRMPMSGDFTGAVDFHTAMNMVVQAEQEFMKLPAQLRERFKHDPGELIAFLEDEGNRDEAIKLGLVEKPAEKVRDVVQAVDELAAKIAVPAK